MFPKGFRLRFLVISFIVAVGFESVGQQFTVQLLGPTHVYYDDQVNYDVVFLDQWGSASVPPYGIETWTVSGGTKLSEDQINCTVRWTSAGARWVNYDYETFDNWYWDRRNVTVDLHTPVLNEATSVSTMSFTISWTATPGATGYSLDVSTQSNFSSMVSGYNNLLISENSISVNNLTPNQQYFCRVRAVNGSYQTNSSSARSVLLFPSPPPQPTASYVTANSFTASWSTVPNASRYLLDVSRNSGFTDIVTGYSNLVVNGMTQEVTGLAANTDYFFRVRTENPRGISSSSAIGSTKTLTQVPSIPTALDASKRYGDGFRANWIAVPTAESYLLDVSTAIHFNSFVDGYDSRSVSSIFFDIVGLDPGRSYYYRVRAVNSGGRSEVSNIIKVNLDLNYVRTTSAQVAGKLTGQQLQSASINEKMESYEFFDGLGRAIQTIVMNQSPGGRDVVQPIVYDSYGRTPVAYLPYTKDHTAWYDYGFIDKDHPDYELLTSPQFHFYQSWSEVASDEVPYAETVFENSPLSRPLRQYGPGKAWSRHQGGSNRYTGFSYEVNKDGTSQFERVIAWRIDSNGQLGRASAVTGYVVSGGFYASGQISIKITTDEQGHQVREYADKQGRVILKKVQAVEGASLENDFDWAQTYYIYDDYGNLVMVLPPEAVKALIEQ